MHSPAHSGCAVTGTLSVLLRMSQIAGVAPLRFEKTRDGYSVRVSSVANCYGQLLSFILWSLSTITIATDIMYQPEKSFRTRTNSNRIVWVADVGTVGLVVCAAAVTGLHRMKCLTVYMLQLQEINLKLNLYHEEPSNEKVRMFITMTSLVLTVTTIVLDYSIFMYQVITENGKVITSSMYIFYNISTVVLQVIVLTFSQIVTSVLTSLQTFNKCLKSLLQEIHNETSYSKHDTNKECRINMYSCINSYKSINSVIDTMAVYRGPIKTTPKPVPTIVRLFAVLYCSLCDVVRQIIDSHGPVLVALLLSLFLHLVITPYHVITNIFHKARSDHSSVMMQITWAVVHFSNLLLVIEPCHQACSEMDLTKQLVSQMTQYTPPENYALLSELEIFYRHLILNEVSCSPMRMFPLNRTLIITFLGSITTYLVVIIQL